MQYLLSSLIKVRKTFKSYKYRIFTPTKFYFGIPILWRGNDFNLINKFVGSNLMNFFTFSKKKINKKKRSLTNNNLFLFNSARSAIAFSLRCLGIKVNDEVIISSFTCNAVTYGVKVIGAIPIYVDINNDLTMNYFELKKLLNKKTKAVIVQNTFGRLGLSIENIKEIKSKGIYVIIDDSLSYGSKNNNKFLYSYGDLSLWTYEASKTLTIGWGGHLRINNPSIKNNFQLSYKDLKRISIFEDLRKFFQLWISLFFQKHPLSLGPIIWQLFYFLGIIKSSNIQNKKSETSIKKIGFIGESLFNYYNKIFDRIYKLTRSNYCEYEALFRSLKIQILIKEDVFEKIVSPRFPLLIKKDKIEDFLNFAKNEKIEIGRWFSDLPEENLEYVSENYLRNTKNINKGIINFPCYWTLNKKEKFKIKSFILKSAKLNYFINI